MGGLDINWFRADKGYNPKIIRKSVQSRFRDPQLVDTIIDKDQQWRKLRYQLDSLKKTWNDIGKQIKDKKKLDKQNPCANEIQAKDQNQAQQKQIEEKEKNMINEINALINKVGNIVHESVHVSNNEEDNPIIRKWGEIQPIKITGKKGALHHHEVLQAIGGYDPKRGQKVAGHRGYYLTGPGVLLNNALISYGLAFLHKRNYELVQPPFFMKKQIMAETCQLGDFDEMLYRVDGGEGQDYYLIATSQQPISAMHRGEWIPQNQLPIKYGGSSSCFRKQAGAHGKDTWGLFRIHQFEKIEQFILTKPEESWEAFEVMIKQAEQFYQSLKLPYQVISIVSGALNDAASKKYDLEAWFPGYNAYRQLVSISNCTDFQSRNLQVRCGVKKGDDKEKKYVHMLNGTLCATERALCCILQNYQTEKGLQVPQVLQPYVGTDFIPFKEQPEPIKKIKPQKNKKYETKIQHCEQKTKQIVEEKIEKKVQQKNEQKIEEKEKKVQLDQNKNK